MLISALLARTLMCKYKKMLVGGLLGIFVFCAYYFAIKAWFFAEEDFMIIFRAAQIRSFFDFCNSCVQGITHYYAINCTIPKSVFFPSVYFRPIVPVIAYFQYLFFGLNAYSYFVVTILLHAVITSLLFGLFTSVVATSTALLFSLFFAFHPTLFDWLGKIDLQQHHVALLFALLSVMALKKSIVSGSKIYALCSYGFFLVSILSRETFLILPGIIFLVLKLFPELHENKLLSLKSQAKTLVGFCAVILVFFLLRISVNASVFLSSGTTGWFFCFNNGESLIAMAASFFKFLYNILLWPMLFPWSTYLFFQKYHLIFMYNALRVFIAVLLISCFVTNAKKKAVMVLFACALLMCWPLLVIPYGWSYRFFYEGLPFYCGALALLFDLSSLKKSGLVLVGKIVFAVLIIINALFVMQNRNNAASGNKFIVDAIQTLKSPEYASLKKYPFVFINSDKCPNVPYLGSLHALHLYDICGVSNANYEFYFLKLHQEIADLLNCFDVVFSGGGVRLISRNQRAMWIIIDERFLKPNPFFIKRIEIHQQNALQQVFDLSIIFEQQYLDSSMQLLIWSEKDRRFFLFKTSSAAT